MLRPILLATLALQLGACDSNRGDGTSVTINRNNNAGDGNAAAAIDGKSGAVKIDLPGFKGEFTLPKIKLDADNFDLNGVHIAFSSPAAPATVRDWFLGRLKTAGFTLHSEGDAIVGQDEDKKPFRMELTPKGADRSAGTIVIGT
ncbi:hypothetical protein [Sphingomonas sp.]|uniref:hypothetical protein n=1 Tax=Sphingomonas sp. TaxID=28214 RepID=UPI0035BBBA91